MSGVLTECEALRPRTPYWTLVEYLALAGFQVNDTAGSWIPSWSCRCIDLPVAFYPRPYEGQDRL